MIWWLYEFHPFKWAWYIGDYWHSKIHISNDNSWFLVCIDFVFPLSLTKNIADLTTSNTVGILLYETEDACRFPVSWLGQACWIVCFLCCDYLFCLSSFCVLCSMLRVSLNCPFLSALSVFSTVYSAMTTWQKQNWEKITMKNKNRNVTFDIRCDVYKQENNKLIK